jgi:hypothetical protein
MYKRSWLGLVCMVYFTADQLVPVVEDCVMDTLGVVSSHPVERERYRFGRKEYEACVFKLEWFHGLKIVGQRYATSIKMRGYVIEPDTESPYYARSDSVQAPCIRICDDDDDVLSEIKGYDKMSLYNGLKAIISPVVAVSSPVDAVSSPVMAVSQSQWLKLMERVFNQVQGARGTSVSKELLVSILQDILQMLRANR